MRYDVVAVWGPMQSELLRRQNEIERQALGQYKHSPDAARHFLTKYSIDWGAKVVNRAWKLGDELWTKYDEQF